MERPPGVLKWPTGDSNFEAAPRQWYALPYLRPMAAETHQGDNQWRFSEIAVSLLQSSVRWLRRALVIEIWRLNKTLTASSWSCSESTYMHLVHKFHLQEQCSHIDAWVTSESTYSFDSYHSMYRRLPILRALSTYSQSDHQTTWGLNYRIWRYCTISTKCSRHGSQGLVNWTLEYIVTCHSRLWTLAEKPSKFFFSPTVVIP